MSSATLTTRGTLLLAALLCACARSRASRAPDASARAVPTVSKQDAQRRRAMLTTDAGASSSEAVGRQRLQDGGEASPPDAAPLDASRSEPRSDSGTTRPQLDAALDASVALTGPLLDAAPPITMPLRDGAVDDEDAGPTFREPRVHCMGKPGSPGDSTRTWNDRSYLVHIPEGLDPNAGMPVLFVYHGAGGNGPDTRTGTGFDLLADQLGFITVYPNGAMGNAPWNVGRNVCPPGNFVSTRNDDFAYFDAMLDGIEADQCIDRERVFVTGLSMGGYFAHHIGCQLGHTRIRAIAPHSAGTYAGDCPGAPLPVLILHGDSDSLINYRCATSARDYWIERNGCSSEVDTLNITGGHCDFNRGCPKDGQVVLCTFNGLDHAYAYPPDYEFSSLLIWEFFDQYW